MADRRYYLLAGVLALIAYVVLLTAEAKTVKPWNDEAMAASAAYNLGTRGTTGVHFFDEKSPFFPGITRHTYYIFPFQLCVLAFWYKIAGFSLLSTRLISTGWTLVTLGALYSLLKGLTGDRIFALLAASLAAVDYHIMTAGGFGRYDTLVSAMGFSAYSLYIYFRSRNLAVAILTSNTCVMMAGATHPNGVLYLIGLWFLILYFDRKRLNLALLGITLLPYLAGAALWTPFVLQDFPSFRQQLGMNSSGRVGLLHPVATLVREIRIRYITGFGLGAHSAGHGSQLVKLKALSLLLYLSAAIVCFFWKKMREKEGVRVVLILFSIHLIYMTFYENMKFSYYLVHLDPLYCVLLAAFAVTLWRTSTRRMLHGAIACILLTVGLVDIGGIVMKIRLNDYAKSYVPAVDFVRQNAADVGLVAGSCSFGFGYGFDGNLLDDPSLGYYNGRRPDFIVAEEIYDGWWEERRSVQPEVFGYCARTLQDYSLVYDHNGYRVYRRRELRASTNGASREPSGPARALAHK